MTKRALGDPFPAMFEPQLATLVDTPPEGGEWVYESKYDGYRALAWKRGAVVTLVSRRGLRMTHFDRVADAVAALACRDAIFDGEVCAIEENGITSFEALQQAISHGRTESLVYFVFDLLYVDGEDLRSQSLEARKARLAELVEETGEGFVRRAEHVRGRGASFMAAAGSLGLEGIVAKRADKTWRSGRSLEWQKIKIAARQELVIVGYTAPRGTRSGFGAILVGVKNEGSAPTTFRYAGKVGTGFDEATLRSLHRRMQTLEVGVPSVTDAPRMRDARWVRPELVCEVRFTDWTRDGKLRHPVFVGLREDKAANDVGRERPRMRHARRTG